MRKKTVTCYRCKTKFNINYGGESRSYIWDSSIDQYICGKCMDEEINRYRPKKGEK